MKKYLIALALVGMVTTSCYEKLNITPPNQITEEQIKELLKTADEKKAATMLAGIANPLRTIIPTQNTTNSGGADYRYYRYAGEMCMRGYEGNDMVFGAVGADGFGLEEYQLGDFTGTAVDKNEMYWNCGWQWVTAANKVLNILDDQTVGTNAQLQQYQSWALMMRAFAYNFLLDNYQLAYTQGGSTKLGMPYYDRYDVGQPYRARSTMQGCYDSINKDLDKAIGILEAAGIWKSTDKFDITASVVNFLKARVALATGNWGAAITACDKIIANSGASLMTADVYVAQPQYPDAANPTKVFYYAKNSGFLNIAKNTEAIWGWTTKDAATQNNNNPVSHWLNTYGFGSGGGGNNYTRIDDRLYNKMDPNDFRRDNFLSNPPKEAYDYGDNVKNVIMPYANLKFASSDGTTSSATDILDVTKRKASSCATDWTLMRLAEVYLMKAEAEAQSGTGDAKATLNKLLAARSKGGVTLTCDTYAGMAGMSALEMVKLQTRIEMWGENGLEFYNNKRWAPAYGANAVDRTGSTVHWAAGTLTQAQMKLQLPQAGTNFNGLLVQD